MNAIGGLWHPGKSKKVLSVRPFPFTRGLRNLDQPTISLEPMTHDEIIGPILVTIQFTRKLNDFGNKKMTSLISNPGAKFIECRLNLRFESQV